MNKTHIVSASREFTIAKQRNDRETPRCFSTNGCGALRKFIPFSGVRWGRGTLALSWFFYLFLIKNIFFSRLYVHHGARTYNPQIRCFVGSKD